MKIQGKTFILITILCIGCTGAKRVRERKTEEDVRREGDHGEIIGYGPFRFDRGHIADRGYDMGYVLGTRYGSRLGEGIKSGISEAFSGKKKKRKGKKYQDDDDDDDE